MDFQELLKDKVCTCGKVHTCSIKHVIIESGAINKINSLVDSYQNVLLIADNNTYQVCYR